MRDPLRLGLLMAVLSLAACGTRAPSNPSAWLSTSLDLIDGRDTSTRFRMWIEIQRMDTDTGALTRMKLARQGDASSRSASLFHIEAETQAELLVDGELVSSGMIRDTQIGDGRTRWLQMESPDSQPPAVQAHALDGAGQEKSDPLTRAAAPIDLDPLGLLRLYAQQAEWAEEPASEKRYVVLIGTLTPELRDEITRLGSGYLPERIRLSLDRDTGLPIELEIVDDGHDQPGPPTGLAGKLKIRYLGWTIDRLADTLFMTSDSDPSGD